MLTAHEIQKISVIIPVFNDVKCLDRLLKQLSSFDPHDIVVADGGSQDGSQDCARRYPHVRLVQSARGRGCQIANGIQAAMTDTVWVLHADSIIPAHAFIEIDRILSQAGAAMGCFPIAFDSDKLLLSVFAGLSRFDSPWTTFGDQGFFFRRVDYRNDPPLKKWPILEDVRLRKMLKIRHGGKVVKSSVRLKTSARRFLNKGILRTQIRNAWILLRYHMGASPQTLHRAYYCETAYPLEEDPTSSADIKGQPAR